ncbi:hypothetical protein GGG16DRAFT_122018 [Schizophyllum commune]
MPPSLIPTAAAPETRNWQAMVYYPGGSQDDLDDEYEASKREMDAQFYQTFPGARVHLERLGIIKPGMIEPMKPSQYQQYLEELQITARVHAPLPSSPVSLFDTIYGFSHSSLEEDAFYGSAASGCFAHNGEAEQTSSGYQPASQFGECQTTSYGQVDYSLSDWYPNAASGDQPVSPAVAADHPHPVLQDILTSPQAYVEYAPAPPPITPTSPTFATTPTPTDHAPHATHPPPSAPAIDTTHEVPTVSVSSPPHYQPSPPRSYEDLTPSPAREAEAAAAAVARGRRHHTMQNRRGRVALPPLEKPAPSSAEKPPLACLFCRGRKIACGAPAAGSNTCNQCARRGLTCVYPTENRRGTRTRQPTRRSPQPRGRKRDAPPPAPGVEGMQIYEPDSMWPLKGEKDEEEEDDDMASAGASSSSDKALADA